MEVHRTFRPPAPTTELQFEPLGQLIATRAQATESMRAYHLLAQSYDPRLQELRSHLTSDVPRAGSSRDQTGRRKMLGARSQRAAERQSHRLNTASVSIGREWPSPDRSCP